MGKHKKRLRAEKAKVQLKKKKLPKGQNVTDTSFKVKKILTVEQLKKVDEDEPVSNWNVSLKDLLNRLSHFNYTTRLNSLTGIKEILTKSNEILLGPSFKVLISRLLERLTDEEHKIRVTAMNLISYILGLLQQELIIPYYDLLNVHLACAMTHRNISIQKDSLKFVDVMVQYCPRALEHNLEKLMQNFIRIIKTFMFGSQTHVFSLKAPNEELEKTKTEILVGFYRFLAACYPNDVQESFLRNSNKNVLEKQKISLRGTLNFYKSIPDLSEVFKNSLSKGKVRAESDSADLKPLCSLVMPLLLDTWKEFSPNKNIHTMSECVLSEALGELLCVLLKIMLLLCEKVMAVQDQELVYWFTSNYSQEFKKFFAIDFPYFPSVSRKRTRSSNPSEIQKGSPNSCVEQNLIICYLCYSFKLAHGNSDLETKIEEYILNALKMKNSKEADILGKVVEAALNSSRSKESSLLRMVVQAHGVTKSSELRRSLSKVLSKLALEEIEKTSQRSCEIRNWVKFQLHLLCRSQFSGNDIETILKLIIKPSGAEILGELESKAEEIAENLPNIKVEGMETFESQRIIACILYRCNEDVLKRIMEKQILNGSAYPENLRNYMLEIFSQKLGR